MAALSKTRDTTISALAYFVVYATAQFSFTSGKKVKQEVCHIHRQEIGRVGEITITSLPTLAFSRRAESDGFPREKMEVHEHVIHDLRLLPGLPVVSPRTKMIQRRASGSLGKAAASALHFPTSEQFRPRRHALCVGALGKSTYTQASPGLTHFV